jgi:hypothetical protein
MVPQSNICMVGEFLPGNSENCLWNLRDLLKYNMLRTTPGKPLTWGDFTPPFNNRICTANQVGECIRMGEWYRGLSPVSISDFSS